MTASCHYINRAMKDIKKEFFEGPTTYAISDWDSASTNEQTDRLMYNL